MKALTLSPSQQTASVQELPTPEPKGSEILVKVHAIALNPVDAMSVAHPLATQTGRVVGSDFAGEVVAVAEKLRGSSDPRVQIGARVAGFLQGVNSGNDRPGAFAEYVTPEADLVWLIPAGVPFTSAAAITLGATTTAQGVFYRLGMSCPWWRTDNPPSNSPAAETPITVFIYGASTSIGLYAAQLVRLSSTVSGTPIRILGAASTRHHALLNGAPYDYDGLVDYRDTDWTARVRGLTPGARGVDFAVDCISEGRTVELVGSVLRRDTGKYAVFRAPEGGGYKDLYESLPIKPVYGAVWEGLGVEVAYRGFTVPASPTAREFAAKFYDYLSESSQEGKLVIQPNPVRLMPGGLERVVPDGFQVLSAGVLSAALKGAHARTEEYMKPISAEKLVYRII